MNDISASLKDQNDFKKLYKENFHKISRFVRNNSGCEADAEDLFQDAVMVLVEKAREEHFQLTASIDTYLYAICNNMWLKKLRERNHHLSNDGDHERDFEQSMPDPVEHEKSYLERLKEYLLKITAHCNRLIHDIFFKEKTMEEIQQEYGYATKHNAQNQKHKCVEQIRKVKAKEEKKEKI